MQSANLVDSSEYCALACNLRKQNCSYVREETNQTPVGCWYVGGELTHCSLVSLHKHLFCCSFVYEGYRPMHSTRNGVAPLVTLPSQWPQGGDDGCKKLFSRIKLPVSPPTNYSFITENRKMHTSTQPYTTTAFMPLSLLLASSLHHALSNTNNTSVKDN